MKVEHIHDGVRYVFSNDDIKVNDKVFPIAEGRLSDDSEFIYKGFTFEDYMTGFPNDPHTILNLKHSTDCKAYEVRTDMGFGPVEKYFKIVSIKPLKLSERVANRPILHADIVD